MKYIRNQKAVLAQLVVNKSNQVLTKVPCKIQVPVRFSEVGLGQIGINTYILGCFPIILETGEYSVCNVNTYVELTPSKLNIVTINDVDYHEFSFDANTTVIKSTELVKNGDLMFNILDEFIFKGKIPWYIGYEDLGKMFDTASEFAGSNVANNLEVIEFLASLISRHKEDRTKYIRTGIDSYKDVELANLSYVPLMSVFYSVKSTLNKVAGSYFNDGVVSALVSANTEVENIESIIRA